jgi:2-methylcitrate dehydratase
MQFVLDPVQGAFNIGTIIRWLDFNVSRYSSVHFFTVSNFVTGYLVGRWVGFVTINVVVTTLLSANYSSLGHPSDNLGAILAVCEYVSNQRVAEGEQYFCIFEVQE